MNTEQQKMKLLHRKWEVNEMKEKQNLVECGIQARILCVLYVSDKKMPSGKNLISSLYRHMGSRIHTRRTRGSTEVARVMVDTKIDKRATATRYSNSPSAY